MSESISYLSSLSILLPLACSLFFFRRIKFSFKLLGLLVFIGSILEAAFYLFRGEFTMILLNSYTLIEAILLTSFFYFIFRSTRFKKITWILLATFFLVFVVSTAYHYSIDVNNPATLLSESIVVLILTFFCFSELIQQDEDNYYSLGETWVVIGLLFYFGGNIFTFSYSADYFGETQNFKFDVWLTHSLINIVLNICLAVAFFIEGVSNKLHQSTNNA